MPPPLWFLPLDLRGLKQCLKGLLASCISLCCAVMLTLTSSVRQPPHLHATKDIEASAPIDHQLPPASPASFVSAPPSNCPVASKLSPPSGPSSAPATPTTSSQAGQTHEKASKRPKLSLQTSCVPTAFGKSTTALSFSLSTQATSSPTVRNTFNNTYDGYRGVGPVASSTPQDRAAAESPSTKYGAKSLKTASSCTATTNGAGGDATVPYQLPLGIRSILRNSPVPVSSLRRSSSSASATAGRKKLFPAEKRVNYRFPIEEEITTVRFVAKHSDLLSPESSSATSDATDSGSDDESDADSVSSGSSPGSSCSSDEDMEGTGDDNSCISSEKQPNAGSETRLRRPARRRKRKYQRSERQVLAAGVRDGLIDPFSDWETPRTPIHRKRKRPRKWRWTLGPIKDGYVQDTSPAEMSIDTPVLSQPSPSTSQSS